MRQTGNGYLVMKFKILAASFYKCHVDIYNAEVNFELESINQQRDCKFSICFTPCCINSPTATQHSNHPASFCRLLFAKRSNINL